MRFLRIAALVFLAGCGGGAEADNAIAHGTSTLFQGSTNRGTFPTHADCVIAAQARVIAVATSYQCRENLAVSPPPPAPAAPTVALSANPSNVATPGGTSTLTWSSANASTCEAGGSWNGTKAIAGSEATAPITAASTFSLLCSGPGGTGNASTTVTVGAVEAQTGLDFPSNSGDYTDVRFKFTGAALNPIQPATYIWSVMPRQQSGYYTTFFWGFGDGSFTGSRQYYGAHPYPNGGESGTTHKWEISATGHDFTDDANGHDTTVVKGRWYTQALVVAPSGSNSVLDFYWDLPDTSKRISTTLVGGLSAPSSPALNFGDAPWNVHSERLSGVLRGIRVYSASLALGDVLSEAQAPLSTTAGTAGVWYMNMNPTPTDISDKSGRGHNPTWAGPGRPALWSQ